MTNREALRMGWIPCEADKANGALSYTNDEFHGVAVITVKISSSDNGDDPKLSTHEPLVHVCFDCATKHFKSCYAWQTGVVWTK